MLTAYHQNFGQAYGTGFYDQSTYQGAAGSSGSSLTSTGIAVASIVTLAALILLTALVVRIWRRARSRGRPE